MTARTKTKDHGAGAGARGGAVSAAAALVFEHAGLCGLVARACDRLRLDWHRAAGETDTERRMAALRSWLDGQEAR